MLAVLNISVVLITSVVQMYLANRLIWMLNVITTH
jgi:hypothetical protein